MMFKSNLKASLDSIRKEVGDKDNMYVIENPVKKVKLFALYINNRIENLLRKEVCQNAKIVESYYSLNRIKGKEVGNCVLLEINKWRDEAEYYDINILEVAFQHKLKLELIEDYSLLSLLDVNASSLFSHHLGHNENTIPDIKKAFAKLEVINKKITTYYKVHGFLKDIRLEQQNTVLYRILPLEEIKLGLLSQSYLSSKHIDPDHEDYGKLYLYKDGEKVSKEESEKHIGEFYKDEIID